MSGYRADRQDNVIRKFFAFGWNTLMRLLFGYLCHDLLFRSSVTKPSE